MVAKCANQDCTAEFHRLLEGKVYVGEVRTSPDAPRERRYAWLCNKCSDRMTVVFDKESGDAGVLFVVDAA